jgi:glutamine amidotransferase
LADATRIILPGVGNIKAAMSSLKTMNLLPKLEKAVLRKKVPFFAVCTGMQLLFDRYEHDDEDISCLGWFSGRVVKFDLGKAPIADCSKVCFVKKTPLIAQGQKDEVATFINPNHVLPADEADIWALADNKGAYVAGVQRDNIYAIQFHLDKGDLAIHLLKGFLGLELACEKLHYRK